jgi:2-polyprenyl-6-methoxyphenol hydroxylase-like FAD-dependent oxidoreductase
VLGGHLAALTPGRAHPAALRRSSNRAPYPVERTGAWLSCPADPFCRDRAAPHGTAATAACGPAGEPAHHSAWAGCVVGLLGAGFLLVRCWVVSVVVASVCVRSGIVAKDVIVVGAGPVGLMLAGEVRLGGADVAVYDRLPGPSGESRGVGFTRRAAEVFDQRGLLDRFGEVEWAQGHFGGVRIDFAGLADNHFSVRGIPQFRTEEILEAWLRELGVVVHRSHEVTGYRQSAEEVTVQFRGPGGPGRDSARYLVGCDGARSLVRNLAGIGFPGWGATRGMYMADVVGSGVRPRPIGERVEGGMVMAFNLQNGVDRIVIHDEKLRPHEDRSTLRFAEVADAWQRMTGESLHHAEVRWISSFTDTTRQAAAYRAGRVFLAGDAAHIHMPAGAQGMSVGVQDAANLGWKLAAAAAGWAPDGLLDTYQDERHPVGRMLMRNTRAQTRLYLSGEEMEPLREVIRDLVQIPEVARHLAGTVSGLDIRYNTNNSTDNGTGTGTGTGTGNGMGSGAGSGTGTGGGGHPLTGLRLPPDAVLQRAGGGAVRVAELLHAARPVLVVTGDAVGDTGVWQAADGWSDRVGAVTGTWISERAGDHDLPEAVLLRPDGYVAWASPGSSSLPQALEHWFGRPQHPAPPTENHHTTTP